MILHFYFILNFINIHSMILHGLHALKIKANQPRVSVPPPLYFSLHHWGFYFLLEANTYSSIQTVWSFVLIEKCMFGSAGGWWDGKKGIKGVFMSMSVPLIRVSLHSKLALFLKAWCQCWNTAVLVHLGSMREREGIANQLLFTALCCSCVTCKYGWLQQKLP